MLVTGTDYSVPFTDTGSSVADPRASRSGSDSAFITFFISRLILFSSLAGTKKLERFFEVENI